MRTPGLFLQIFFGLVVTSNSQTTAQGGAETPTSFVDNAMKLREEVLFKLEPGGIQRSLTDTVPGKFFWHTSIVTTTFWIGETPCPARGVSIVEGTPNAGRVKTVL